MRNRGRLVANQLATLPAGDHTDPSTVGLQLRVRGESRTWLFRFTWRGQWVRLTVGHWPATSLIEAREIAQGLQKRIAEGIDPRRSRPTRTERPAPLPGAAAISAPDAKHTVAFLAGEFLERHVKPNRKRPEYVAAILEKDVLPEWRGRDARTIKPREVIELLDSIVERGSKVMANRVAGVLSQMFRYGVHRALIDASPVQLLYRPGGKERPRERSLTDDELRAFLADPRAATRFERLEHVIMLLLLTGQRRGELALARWEHIDPKARTWTIPPENSKTGKGHVVPLSPWAADVFSTLKGAADSSPWVLPNADGSGAIDAKLLTRGLAKCQDRFQKLGIAPFTLHDLRRTCRTGLGRLKVPPHIAERCLNHSQEKIAATYDVGDYLDEKRAALDKWAKHLRGLSK